MNAREKEDLIKYRLSKAKDTFNEVDVQIKNSFLNNAVNRLYYACFYAVSALFIDRNIKAKSHSGAIQMFGLHFVKTGLVNKETGDFYTFIFELRQTGDYEDYIVFQQKEVIDLVKPAADFIAQIEEILTKK